MLTKEKLEEYKCEYDRSGVVVIRELVPMNLLYEAAYEIEKLHKEAFAYPDNRDIYWRVQRDKKFLEKYEPVICYSSALKRISSNQDITKIIKCLLNDPDLPFLLKDKFIYKAPGQDGYPLHQDYNWWHNYPANDICTAVIPFDGIDDNNGGIEFYLGCHKDCFLPQGENRPLSDEETSRLNNFESVVFEMNPGDILVFHSLTPHHSCRNMSGNWRRQFYPTYCSSRVGDVYNKQLQIQFENEKRRNKSNEYGYI